MYKGRKVEYNLMKIWAFGSVCSFFFVFLFFCHALSSPRGLRLLPLLSFTVSRGPGELPGGQGELERSAGPHSDSGSSSPTWERDRRGPPPGPPGPLGPPGVCKCQRKKDGVNQIVLSAHTANLAQHLSDYQDNV